LTVGRGRRRKLALSMKRHLERPITNYFKKYPLCNLEGKKRKAILERPRISNKYKYLKE